MSGVVCARWSQILGLVALRDHELAQTLDWSVELQPLLFIWIMCYGGCLLRSFGVFVRSRHYNPFIRVCWRCGHANARLH